jgi:hypothetical protein
MHALTAALFVAMFLFVSHVNGALHGYLDPGTGSIAIQLVLGGVVAALAMVRMYWARVRTLLGRKSAEPEAGTQP